MNVMVLIGWLYFLINNLGFWRCYRDVGIFFCIVLYRLDDVSFVRVIFMIVVLEKFLFIINIFLYIFIYFWFVRCLWCFFCYGVGKVYEVFGLYRDIDSILG